MPSIFPEINAGGVYIRDADGNPLNPPGVERAYAPPPIYQTTCQLTALPSDCDARIEPRQINAIVSELVALSQCWEPFGTGWDCNVLNNLCNSFQTWQAYTSIHIGDTPPPLALPGRLWWETDTGYTFIYYNDGTSAQWVQIAGGAIRMDGVSIVGSGTVADPYRVGVVDCGEY